MRLYGCFVQLSQRYQTALADASDVAQQALSSIRTVRSFAREDHERERYDRSVSLSFSIGARRAAAPAASSSTSTIAQVSLVAVLWYGCNLVLDKALDIGELTSFLLLAIYTIASLGGLMALFSAIMSAPRLSPPLRAPRQAADSAPSRRRIVELHGHITLEGVFGTVLSRRASAPRRLPQRQPCEVCAPRGASGSGKSSIIARGGWYSADNGRLCVDGVPLAELDPTWWRRQVALVAQEPVLFNGSVSTTSATDASSQ